MQYDADAAPTDVPDRRHARRILIVGGVAGGASCAARLRRLDESVEIVIFDRGPYVAFANCGLPDYVGDVIADERTLLVASPKMFRERFNIEVHTDTDVIGIDRTARTYRRPRSSHRRQLHRAVRCVGPVTGRGADPATAAGGRPARGLRGAQHSGLAPHSWLDCRPSRQHRVVVGGGFIGLEMVENLIHRGLSVTVVEKLPQVMPPLDPEVAVPLAEHLIAKGVQLHLGDGAGPHRRRGRRTLDRGSGERRQLSSRSLSSSPSACAATELAKAAGLQIGSRAGIVVDTQMRTSDPRIWAVGDVVEVPDVVTGQDTVLPLAGPANRQGRVAAESIAGRATQFRGIQATAVVGVLGLTVASTGASEKGLQRAGVTSFEKVYLHPGHHAGYYPGARPIHLKLLFTVPDGRILGAQAIGLEGVEKRIDVIATAIQFSGTVHDLAEAELCYAPQFGAAKDPVNLAGMLAENVLNGDMPVADWLEIDRTEALLVDVREPDEFAGGHIPNAINLPLSQMRDRYAELPTHRDIWTCCGVGQRAVLCDPVPDAARIPIPESDWRVYNVSGIQCDRGEPVKVGLEPASSGTCPLAASAGAAIGEPSFSIPWLLVD